MRYDAYIQLRQAAKEAKELLGEIVSRQMQDKLPRENFWRECGAVRERLQAALDGDARVMAENVVKTLLDDARTNRLRDSINEKLHRLQEHEVGYCWCGAHHIAGDSMLQDYDEDF